MIVIWNGNKKDFSINSNPKKEKKQFNKKISKKNAVSHKIIFKTSNMSVIHKIIIQFRQKILIIIKDVPKQIFKFTRILTKIMILTYKDLQVVWITTVGPIANLMIKQKTTMKATKQNTIKQAIGMGNMKIMKKMKKYQMKVSPIKDLIIDKTKIKNLSFKINLLK